MTSFLPFLVSAEVVKLLLDNQAEIDARDFEGRTPLMYASHSLNCDVTDALLHHNADATLTDLQGMTSLHFLAISVSRFNEDSAIKLLTSLVEAMPKNVVKCFVNKRENISGSTGNKKINNSKSRCYIRLQNTFEITLCCSKLQIK